MLKRLFGRPPVVEPETREAGAFRTAVGVAADTYIAGFRDFIVTERERSRRSGSELKYDVLADSRGLYAGKARLDFMHLEPRKKPVEFGAPKAAPMVPFRSTFGEMDVLVKALRWDEITVAPTMPGFDPAQLMPWFETWFDPEDKHIDPQAELSGRIHKLVLFPRSVFIDMGTAPAAALFALLDLFAAAGATRAVIGGESR